MDLRHHVTRKVDDAHPCLAAKVVEDGARGKPRRPLKIVADHHQGMLEEMARRRKVGEHVVPEMNPAAAVVVLVERRTNGDVAPEMTGEPEMSAGPEMIVAQEMTGVPGMIAAQEMIVVLAMTEDHEMIVDPAISVDLATIVVPGTIAVPEMNVDPEMIADPEMTAVLAISEVRGMNHVAGPVPATVAACHAVGMTDGADAMTTDHVDRHVTNPSGAAATERHALNHLLVKIGDAIGMNPAEDAAVKTAGVAAAAKLAETEAANGAAVVEMPDLQEGRGRSLPLAVVV